jgi:hypothetical protein
LAQKTGIAIATIIVEHLCRILTTYRGKMDGVIASAVSAGTVTSAQAVTLGQFLDLANDACTVIKLVSGY